MPNSPSSPPSPHPPIPASSTHASPITHHAPRSSLFDYLQTASAFMLANFLWVIFSLPIITMPAATAALFAVMLDMVRGRSPEPLGDFLAAFRRHWRQSTALALLNLALTALITL